MQPDEVVLLEAAAEEITTRNYKDYDAYVNAVPLHLYSGEGAEKVTETIPLQPPQTDTQANRHEIPSALGRYFAQGLFNHGSLQPYFDLETSDQAKYLHSEGFDISEPGLLKHLHAVAENANLSPAFSGSSGKMAQAQGKLFVADGNSILVFDPITGTPTTEDPHAGEGAVAVQDITAEGDRIFAALGVNGIHVRSAAGTWSHYGDTPGGTGYLLIEFLKDRIIATTDRDIYEVTASGAAPASKLTLKEGWTFSDLGENGPFIYAPCHDGESLSKVQIFGLDGSLAVVHEGSSWLPENELCYSFKGYLGLVLLGCGRVNSSGGKDALLYKAVPDDAGFLPLQLVAESEGAGSRDLAIRAIATKGRNFLVGWSLGVTSPYGEREGIAIYDPALDSFATHLASTTDTVTPEATLEIAIFEGRVCFTNADGVFYEDTSTYVDTATLISSVATFRNPGLKKWDESKIGTKKLPATSSVLVEYSTLHPEEGVWNTAGTHSTTDATEETFRHTGVESPRLAIKLTSSASASAALAPEIESFSVRVNPTTDTTEYRLVRTLNLTAKLAKQRSSRVRHRDPRELRNDIRALVNDFVTYYEADVPDGYDVRVMQVRELVSVTDYATTNGETSKESFIVVVEMHGRVA